MNLTVAKIAFACTALLLSQPTAFAQAPPKTTRVVATLEHEQISRRAAALQAQVKQAAKSQQLTQQTAAALVKELAEVQSSVVSLFRQQGFVSAAEKASYQRTFAKAEQALASRKHLGASASKAR